MNKELIVAIGIGGLLGLGVAIIFNNFPTSKSTRIQVSTAQISITPKDLNTKQTIFNNIPKPNEIRTKGILTIKGESTDDTILFAQTLTDTIPVLVKSGTFVKDITLKPGYNEIVITSKRKNIDQTKVLKFFYLQPIASTVPFVTEVQATSEAAMLKQKLEKQVLELRSHAQKAFYGTVQSVNDKQLLLENGPDSLKVTLEPEVTKMYAVQGLKLIDIESSDLKKGNQVTVFLSDIGGVVKSYTLYQEPDKVLVVGKISNIVDTNYELTLINYEKTTLKADIDTGTVQSAYNISTHETTKYGFSKLKIGEDILAILTVNSDNTYTIDRYLVVNQK